MTLKRQLFSPEEMVAAIQRMAAGIRSAFPGEELDDIAFLGIYQQGVPLAERLARAIEESTKKQLPVGKLDISMYRDDFGRRSALPLIRETVIPFDVNDRKIILVDDVLSSGRTIRAALDAITDYGRPRLIRLAVLVDRGNPEFPIRADFVGMGCSLGAGSKVAVHFDEDGEETGIFAVNWKRN